MRKLLFLALLLAGPAVAQTVTFTAETTTGVGEVTPVLTWSTSPAADDCVASGDWSGSKGPSGTETLAPITTGATYNLECSWADDDVQLDWTAPTLNTDGSPLTDLASFDIYYGTTQGGPYDNVEVIDDETQTSATIAPLTVGTWCFVITASNANGVESDQSNEACQILADDLVTESVGITVNARPAPPVITTIQ